MTSTVGTHEAFLPVVRAALIDVLEDTMHNVDMQLESNSWVRDEPGIVDWNLVPSAPNGTTLEQQVLARLSARLSAYLSGDGAIDDCSEDENEGSGEDEGFQEEAGAAGEDERDTHDDWGQGMSPVV